MSDEILKLIEAVDPSDTAKLDEIDARVWCFLNDLPYLGKVVFEPHIKAFPENLSFSYICGDGPYSDVFVQNHYNHVFYPSRNKYTPLRKHSAIYAPLYTRSRDALKSIRPEGWQLRMGSTGEYDFEKNTFQPDGKFLCQLEQYDKGIQNYKTVSERMPTEELAELHTIIQAIQHERSQGG